MKYRQFVIEVGIDYPFVETDDIFEVDVELSQKEIDEIVQGGIRLIKKDKLNIETTEFIEVLSKSAFNKINALAEKYAIGKWGNRMSIANGARYEFYLPDEIGSAIFDSEEVQLINKIRYQKESISNEQFHDDSKMLFENNSSGRWKDRLLPDPKWNNQPFGGIWSGPSIGSFEKNFPLYNFHCTIKIGDEKYCIEYTANYYLESFELELRLTGYNENIVNIFEEILNNEGYEIKQRLPIGNPIYSYVIYSVNTNPKQFCATYMNIIDEVIKL